MRRCCRGIKIDRSRIRINRHRAVLRARGVNGKTSIPVIEQGVKGIGQRCKGSRLRIGWNDHLFSGMEQGQQSGDEGQRIIVGEQPARFMALPQHHKPSGNERSKFAPIHQPLPIMAYRLVVDALSAFKQGMQRRQLGKITRHLVVATKKRRKSHSPPNRAPISR